MRLFTTVCTIFLKGAEKIDKGLTISGAVVVKATKAGFTELKSYFPEKKVEVKKDEVHEICSK